MDPCVTCGWPGLKCLPAGGGAVDGRPKHEQRTRQRRIRVRRRIRWGVGVDLLDPTIDSIGDVNLVIDAAFGTGAESVVPGPEGAPRHPGGHRRLDANSSVALGCLHDGEFCC